MTVGEFIKKLKKFDKKLQVIITDGIKCNCYHTDGIYFGLFKEDYTVLDIGIGGADITEDNDPSVKKKKFKKWHLSEMDGASVCKTEYSRVRFPQVSSEIGLTKQLAYDILRKW